MNSLLRGSFLMVIAEGRLAVVVTIRVGPAVTLVWKGGMSGKLTRPR